MKKLSFFGSVLVFLANIFLVGLLTWQILFPRLTVVMCDVGQGDAILISHDSNQILIDGGPDQKVLSCLNHHLPLGDRTVEMVVATHMDADHIGGLTSVLTSFKVKTLVVNHQEKQTAVFDRFWQVVQAKKDVGMQVISVGWLDQLKLGDDLNFISFTDPPTSGRNRKQLTSSHQLAENRLWDKTESIAKNSIDSNNRSIVLFLKFKHILFLFTGDLEKDGELALINTGVLSKINVLKVGHHGSKSSTGMSFLRVLTPEISLIGVGKDNNYGHPSSQVVNELLEVGSKVYRTDLSGDIVLTTDGRQILIKTQK